MNRIAVQALETPLQGPDGGRVELIGATVARAVNGLDGACNAIGGWGCPIVAIDGYSRKKTRKERKKVPKKERKEV